MGGKCHVKVNMQLGLIAHKYHEGHLKKDCEQIIK